jgi:protein involved in polysaccharide export with SLBB domain
MKFRIRFWVAAAGMLLVGCAYPGKHKPEFAPAKGKPVAAPAESVALNQLDLTNGFDPNWLKPSTEPFTLGPGDKLEIELLGETTSRITTVVAPDGKIYFNLLPGVDVWGLTLSQAKAEIEKGLAKYMREHPQVSLVLREVESKHVWILGHVQAPGIYPLSTPTTLLEAISLAGGALNLSSFRQAEAFGASDELADLRRSFVLRHGKMLPVDFQRLILMGDLSQNIYLQSDDFIYLPAARTREIYVLGAVAEARAVPFKEGMTVAGAIASAYGTVNGAYLQHVAVVRGSLSHPQIAIVDYKYVLRGMASDLAVQPGDIVYVPWSPYRYIQRYAQLVVDTFVSSAAINGGTALVGQPKGVAGVFIPVGSSIQVLPPISPPPIH